MRGADSWGARYNGLKPDIAGALENVKASFLRFPGKSYPQFPPGGQKLTYSCGIGGNNLYDT